MLIKSLAIYHYALDKNLRFGKFIDMKTHQTASNTVSNAGFVALLGRSNVGKSTLINALICQKIAAVSPRSQTTRKQQMGILTVNTLEKNSQVVFIDTPGFHHPRNKLGELMNTEVSKSLEDCDLVLLIIDASESPTEEDQLLFNLLFNSNLTQRTILVFNKLDLVSEDVLADRVAEFSSFLPNSEIIRISATRGDGLFELKEIILQRIPAGEPFFPDDQLTDLQERDLSADLIREACLNILRDEIPHGIAVRIDQYTERGDEGAYIEATVFVEKESHKPILIGKDGQMLKKIGTTARQKIEALTGRKIFLQLKVKVRKNWRNDEKVLRKFGRA